MSESIKKLTELFAKFPTIGQRTAGRFVFYLIGQPKENVDELVQAIQELKKNISSCPSCFQSFQAAGKSVCDICANPARSNGLLCIIEKESDLLSIESAGTYKGLYFILSPLVSYRAHVNENLRLPQLKEKIAKGTFSEIIVALNPTPEGKTMAILVERMLKETPQFPTLKITHLAKGLPVGGELEYADQETLESAFEGRK
jgi:recombination protein RecR